MNKINHGVFNLSDEEGENESERILMKLCRKSFLSLWAFANTHTDEDKKSESNSAKEFCDVLVVFENDVIIFSDKHINFNKEKDLQISWNRWHKKAVIKSKNQLRGAKKWVERFPDRVFLDAECSKKLPVEIKKESKIHLIAVTRGTAEAATNYHGDYFGSHMLYANNLDQRIIDECPFLIDQTYDDSFCHVFDEVSLEIIMHELDTIADFKNYLIKREALFKNTKNALWLKGEESLLASYLSNPLQEEIISISDTSKLVHYDDENLYLRMTSQENYIKYRKKVENSYIVDDLIEKFIRLGDPNLVRTNKKQSNQDLILAINLLASEPRSQRVNIAEQLTIASIKAAELDRSKYMRCFMVSENADRAYCFLFLARDLDISDQEYREKRLAMLHLYSVSIAKRYLQLNKIISLGFNHPKDKKFPSSEDLLVFFNDGSEWDRESSRKISELERDFGIDLITVSQ